MPAKLKDIAGQKIGRWDVGPIAGTTDGTMGGRFYLCRCECGTEKFVTYISLRHRSKSCGCLKNENLKTTEQAFWEKVDKNGPIPPHLPELGPCWVWVGAKQAGRYGSLQRDGKILAAHRVSWFIHFGKWPDKNVLHKCDNTICVNPSHLFLGTHADNMKDMVLKGRHNRSKLTKEQVLEMRSLHATGNYLLADLATRYAMSESGVHLIVTGKNWKHV
jgi:hypothetical protein